jgi:pimeloyl-ACP methyl ester carboxylesterase
MKKYLIDVENEKIAVHESVGKGQAVILLHGNSFSSKSFYNQLEGPIGNNFRLIAIDLPGHGESLPASDPKNIYSLPGYARIIHHALNQLEISNPVLVGHSLGGHVVLELSKMVSNVKGILIFGTPPLGKPPALQQAFNVYPGSSFLSKRRINEDQIKLVASALIKEGGEVPQFILDDIQNTDPKARSLMTSSTVANLFYDEIDIVSSLEIPLAVIHGAHDPVVNLNYINELQMPTLWQGKIQTIENAGHCPQYETPEQFNKILEQFLLDL